MCESSKMLERDYSADLLLEKRFCEFVQDSAFPCVGAKSALNKGQMNFLIAQDITSAWDDLHIWPHISALAKHYRSNPELFQTLVVIFRNKGLMTEENFERAIWARLQSLSDKDEWLGEVCDPRVSADPEDPHFAVSFGGEAFFIVGLHPNSSRPARRFSHPVMVFNLHDQFERLRAAGRYEPLRETILKRDEQLAGSRNPMLAEHGEISSARQYSGRGVEDGWECPYARRKVDTRETA
jgi:uncharacterized protein